MKSLYAVILGLFVFGANAQNLEKHYPVKPGYNQPQYQERHYYHDHERRSHVPHNQINNYYYQPVRPAYPVYQERYYQPYNYYYAPQPVIIERGRRDWVAPLIGGVILGAVITEANRNYYYGY